MKNDGRTAVDLAELRVFGDPCEEQVVFSVDGIDRYRFDLDEYRMWSGVVSVNGEKATIRADYYISTVNGWMIVCETKSPWEYKEKISYNESYANDEDVFLVFEIPSDSIKVKEKGFYWQS